MYEKQKEEIRRAADRKAKREEKRKFLPWAKKYEESSSLAKNPLYVDGPKIKHKRKPKAASLRRQAFNRLKAICKEFVLLRAKHRNHNRCEVGIACGGVGDIEVWYHIFPQVKGNAIKYDERNILGSCNSCNAGEYDERKNGGSIYDQRHLLILGLALFIELKTLQGRRQISTIEANLMADRFEELIDRRIWDEKL